MYPTVALESNETLEVHKKQKQLVGEFCPIKGSVYL